MILYNLYTYLNGTRLKEIEVELYKDDVWRSVEGYDFYGDFKHDYYYKSDLDKVHQGSVFSFSLSTAAKLLQERVLEQKEYYTDMLNDINGQLKELEDKYVRSE